MKNKFITFILYVLIITALAGIALLFIKVFTEIELTVEDIEKTGAQIEIKEKKENISTPQIIESLEEDVSHTTSSNITYQSIASSKNFFYNQLDSYAKTIYDGLVANIENMKSGNYTIEYGENFSNVLSKNDGQKELGTYYQSAIEAFLYDYPEVFFLDTTKMYLNIRTTTKGSKTTYNVFISNAEGSKYYAKGFYSENQINQCILQIEQIKNEVLSNANGNTENKIRIIHDYLIENLEYEQTISKDNIYNLYGALVNKECVCEGYAKAFKYLLDEAGVDNVIVIGIGTNSQGQTENHAWNYVAIDGSWYAVDVTWDDPIIQGVGSIFSSSHKNKYFLKGSQTMENDHTPSGYFTEGGKEFYYPNISEEDYR